MECYYCGKEIKEGEDKAAVIPETGTGWADAKWAHRKCILKEIERKTGQKRLSYG